MSSHNGTIISPPQVVVNKAAKRIIIERKPIREITDGIADGRNLEPPDSVRADVSAFASSSVAQNTELEEGEIDADVPSTSTANIGPVADEHARHRSPTNSPAAQNGGENTVQRKLTALERLKSLNFSMPKSTVNPFTVSAQKMAPIAANEDSKTEKKPSRVAFPSRKYGEHAAVALQAPKRRRPNENCQHDGLKRDTCMLIKSFNAPALASWRGRRSEAPRFREDRPFPSANHPPPNLCVNWPSSSRQMAISSETSAYSPPNFGPPEPVFSPPEDSIMEEPRQAPPVSTIRWETVRDLTISPEELKNFSAFDLRSIVEYLLDEETELIRLHSRLQDQIKNVRRSLDRDKQIDQLKKQALAAAAAAKNTEQQPRPSTTKDRKRVAPTAATSEDDKASPEQTTSRHSRDQEDFDCGVAVAETLSKSICEQADARKAHIAQYMAGLSGEYFARTGSHEFEHPREQSKCDQPSSFLPKHKLVTMMKSFFEGVASISDRSLVQENSSL